jgi:PAX-interacting protein 1
LNFELLPLGLRSGTSNNKFPSLPFLVQLDNMVLTNARGGDQVEKMKQFKMVLERMMAVLQLGKQNLQIGLKDKLPLYEKQILNILQNHKKVPQQQPQSGASSDQPQFPSLQQSQTGMQSQQPPQQQQIDNHPNQIQQQLNSTAMPQSNNIGISNAMQQGIQNTLQSDQLLASGTGFGSLPQGAMGATMQNTMNPPQMVGSCAPIGSSNMQHTLTMAGMQTNTSSAQIKQQPQHQEQQIQAQQRMMPTQQQMQQRQLQQRLMQKQQLLQQQLPLQQQDQQQKLQHSQQNQMQQLGQPSDPADLKSRQGAAGMKPGSMYQQHYPGIGPRNSYYSQLKPGANLPISSPQNIQSSSPQISLPSPQVDQPGVIPPTQLKSGTPLQAAASPFVPSPSPPVAPSPMIEDTKLGAGLMQNAATQAGQALPANSAQTSQMGQPQAGSLAVGTPGISASPLLAEFTSPEAGHGTNLSIQVPETEKPIEKLVRLVSFS